MKHGDRERKRVDDVQVFKRNEESCAWLEFDRDGDKDVVLCKCEKCVHQQTLLATLLGGSHASVISIGPKEAGLPALYVIKRPLRHPD